VTPIKQCHALLNDLSLKLGLSLCTTINIITIAVIIGFQQF